MTSKKEVKKKSASFKNNTKQKIADLQKIFTPNQ